MKRLDSLCEVFVDGDWIESKDQSPEGIRLVQTGNIGVGEYKDKSDKARYVSQSTFDRLKCTEVVPGDCLVSRLPEPVGRACIVPDMDQRMITGVDCSIMRFKKGEMEPKFFTYYSQSKEYLDDVAKLITGTTRDRISRTNLGSIPIPVPPAEIRQRIVTKLDAAFAALAEAQAHVERNRANARELFESYLNGVFEGKEGWSRENLGALGRIMYGYTASSTSEPVGPKLLRITDIQDEQVEWTSVPHCLITDEDFTKYELRSGDIVFARTGATTGKSFLIESAPEAVFASYLIRVQVESADLLPEFLILFFRTRLYWDAIKAGTTGSAQGGFNATKLSELIIPFPSKEEQRDIVRQANRLKDETKQLESTYQQKLLELEGLKKGLLGAAFRGEL